MRRILRERLHRIAEYVELILAIIIVVVIIISVYNMIVRIVTNPMEIQNEEQFYYFLESAMSLIVGIEFLKMIIIPTSQNVIETLLFAVARQIIIDHSTLVLVSGILTVAVLFLIKKYLITDFKENIIAIIPGNTTVSRANRIMDVQLPILTDTRTIGELTAKLICEKGIKLEDFSRIKIDNVILTAIKVKNNEVKRVEIEKDIEHKSEI